MLSPDTTACLSLIMSKTAELCLFRFEVQQSLHISHNSKTKSVVLHFGLSNVRHRRWCPAAVSSQRDPLAFYTESRQCLLCSSSGNFSHFHCRSAIPNTSHIWIIIFMREESLKSFSSPNEGACPGKAA